MKATRTQRAAVTSAQKTVAPVTAGNTVAAEFLRLREVEKFFGLKRTYLYGLIRTGSVKSVALRKKGARFGVRLIHVASLRRFLHANMS
jgi:hypothetical protein